MTTIKFSYNDAYGQPSRGSLAFMPHRRHAANETEILPKPFTVPLLNGETTVNLQPNSSSWVWIITEYFEDKAKSFYTTVPDQDGIIPHTELAHISPSSLPAPYDAVEPAWWAEMRAYKSVVGEIALKGEETLAEAQQAIEIGRESIERTQHNASLAKAYSEQSRDYSYESKDYRDDAKTWRDEAQEQADRAATGPESAAERAENAATRSETARDRAIDAEDGSRVHAAEARADATTAQTAASTAVTNNNQARAQADRAESEANRAQGYANDLLAGPSEDADRAEAARDAAQGYRDQAATHASAAATSETNAANYVEDASDHATNARQAYLDMVDELNTPWNIIETIAPEVPANNPLRYRIINGRIQIVGEIADNENRTFGAKLLKLPDGVTVSAQYRDAIYSTYSPNVMVVHVDSTNSLIIGTQNPSKYRLYVNVDLPVEE